MGEQMPAVWRVVVHDLSARWRGWVAFALLAGLAGAVVLAAVAGARRTASAYPRFLEASRAADALVSPANTGFGGYYAALARLPGVLAVAPVQGVQAGPLGPGGSPEEQAVVIAAADAGLGHRVEVPKLLAGRLPLPARPGEVAVDQMGAHLLHLHVGSTLVLGANTGPVLPGPGSRMRHLTERVVGIMVTRGSVLPVNELDKVPHILASPALARLLGPAYRGFDGAFVRLRPGTSVAAFGGEAQALARRFPRTGGQVFVADENTQAAAVERAIRPQAVALYLFALVFAVTALLIVGQAATRILLAAVHERPVLKALGMTRGQLAVAGLLEVAAAAGAGAVVAVGSAVAASPLMPIGPARLAEPGPGVSADAAVLGLGAAGIVVLLVARCAWPAWQSSAVAVPGQHAGNRAASRPSSAALWLTGASARVTATVGARFALERGPGRTAVPVRSALVGTALSVVAVTAAFTFGANLLHLVHAPRLYGKSWDVAIDLQFGGVTPQQAERLLLHAPGVSGWSFGNHGIIAIGRTVVPAVGMTPGRGPLLAPVLLAGRQPRSAHEIVLGTSVLRDIRRQVGQSVTTTIGGHRAILRIVGRAVFPNFGQGSFTPTDLGIGAETVASVLAPQAGAPPQGARARYSIVLMTFAPGPRQAAQIAAFKRSMTSYCARVEQSTCVVTDQRPNGITGYASIDRTPEVLAGVLAVLGLAVLAQLIVLSGRHHRRDFAIMRSIGLLQRQVSAITAWQASIMAAVALLAGLPLGVAAGRWAWALFTAGLGVPADAAIPATVILVIAPAVLLAANAVAFGPGRAAARLHPTEILRAE